MNYNINSNARILIVGDIMLDHYIYGNCNRISPEAPVPVVEITRESYTLGGAGNVLENLNALNCHADIIAVVGRDDNAAIVAGKLADCGSRADALIYDAARCTTVKTRVLSSNHQMIRLDRECADAVRDDVADQISALLKQHAGEIDILILSDYNKGLLTPTVLAEVVAICKAAGVKTIVDPKGLDFSKYQGASIIKPNRKEASLATGIAIHDQDSLERACIKIKETTGCEAVVVTMSEDGIAIYENEQLSIIPTKALGVVDVTGAGDTVIASIAIALASGYSLTEACDFANHAAAIVVSKVGSATATLAEINQMFQA
ncbi:D-glycero-beta-D-manno-heptose-7-phosphate kinase [Mucilaginibacter glaciei]|uniref:D-glycero-beta-D-manno-heptose-7-phosphate kinase n=1 Tax=Mucilaginibacter glaciei TaxID=2772109 RepID=A0A926RZP1_9SPHI|nr:D-glycero-beta-D-manno-heptose-7-phosphate kinase [Mucilaginibacter glaciei]MBD1392065.1 D-glycero-beta-D-manno-heptose-7-phosphate kinase [Mucilaginibacter glaciei]